MTRWVTSSPSQLLLPVLPLDPHLLVQMYRKASGTHPHSPWGRWNVASERLGPKRAGHVRSAFVDGSQWQFGQATWMRHMRLLMVAIIPFRAHLAVVNACGAWLCGAMCDSCGQTQAVRHRWTHILHMPITSGVRKRRANSFATRQRRMVLLHCSPSNLSYTHLVLSPRIHMRCRDSNSRARRPL